MAWVLCGKGTFTPGTNGGTSGAFDMTQFGTPDLLVLAYAGGVDGPSVSDSEGNTWNPLTSIGNAGVFTQLFYAWNATGTSSQTFTVTGSSSFPSVEVMSFSGSLTSGDPLDQQRDNIDTGVTNLTTGSVTPTGGASELMVTSVQVGSNASTKSVSSSFIISDQNPFSGGVNYSGGAAYKLDVTASDFADWSWTATANPSTTIATFFPAVTGKRFFLIPN